MKRIFNILFLEKYELKLNYFNMCKKKKKEKRKKKSFQENDNFVIILKLFLTFALFLNWNN